MNLHFIVIPSWICRVTRSAPAAVMMFTSALWLVACSPTSEPFDLAINSGRVINPESRLDAVRSLGVRHGRIAAISETPFNANRVIDASGLVVSPGFINLHSHSVAQAGYRLELLDGVTTVLELEAGSFPILHFGQQLGDSPLTHIGASVGHAWIRMQVVDPDALAELAATGKLDMSGAAFTETATFAQRNQIRGMLEAELDAGGLGIGFLLDYMTRAVDDAERDMVFEVAARYEVPVFVHVRRGIDGDPAGLLEVLQAAEGYGAAVHICHLNASAMSGVDEWLDEIDAARARGVDVTTEMFLTAGSAAISRRVFPQLARDFAIEYTDVQWAETGNGYRRTFRPIERDPMDRPCIIISERSGIAGPFSDLTLWWPAMPCRCSVTIAKSCLMARAPQPAFWGSMSAMRAC